VFYNSSLGQDNVSYYGPCIPVERVNLEHDMQLGENIFRGLGIIFPADREILIREKIYELRGKDR
jgi:hypothetical protein